MEGCRSFLNGSRLGRLKTVKVLQDLSSSFEEKEVFSCRPATIHQGRQKLVATKVLHCYIIAHVFLHCGAELIINSTESLMIKPQSHEPALKPR